MAEQRTAATPLLGGAIDRREFLAGVAALSAGAVAAANEAHAHAQTTSSKPRFIDFHHHFQSPEWVKYANANGVRVPQFEREPVSNSPWTPQRGIEAMDKAGVDIAYQSHATYYTKQGLMELAHKNPRKSETVIKYARESNEYGARITADSKGRFRFLPVLPLPDIDGCLKEIDYAYSSLKPVGVCLPGSVGGRDYIGNVKWTPIHEELNRRKAIVHVHPAEPDWSLDLEPGIDAPNVWYGVDTAVAIATLLNNNIASKYPNIRWVFSHAGGGFPSLAGRIINLRENPAGGGGGAAAAGGGRGDAAAGGGRGAGRGRGARGSEQGLREARTFYYDCAASTNRFTLQALATLVTNSQLVFGSDYPWSNITSLTTALPECGFTAAQLNALNFENGERMAST
jgi:predicted TIM-barrel fold metal-dependent hydrolase